MDGIVIPFQKADDGFARKRQGVATVFRAAKTGPFGLAFGRPVKIDELQIAGGQIEIDHPSAYGDLYDAVAIN